MASYGTRVDIMMTLEGDLVVGANGDLKLTYGQDSVIRDINKVLRTTNPDWVTHPAIGAGLETFVGAQNTRETATMMERQITDAIIRAEILRPGDIPKVEVVPVSFDEVKVYISILSGLDQIDVSKVIIDFKNGFAEVSDELAEPQATVTEGRVSQNKYLKRIREAS